MELGYDYMSELAHKHSFSSFTDLQDLAFQTKETYNSDNDLFVVGDTSSGKTLIPLLLFEAAVEESEMQGEESPKMLFVVPYRALAAQKTSEMQSFFERKDLKIVQSTGEFRQDDDLIQNAQVNIAVVITEKIYKYESRDPSFLSRYNYIVLDEIGLINNAERGIRLDFILAWAKNQKLQTNKPRIVALGTPFFDWSAYISHYNFTALKLDKRPVQLQEISVVYSNVGIERVDGECDFLHRVRRITTAQFQNMADKYGTPGSQCVYLDNIFCPFETPCRSNPNLLCSSINKPCPDQVEFVAEKKQKVFYNILLQICRRHLIAGQQVLIFVNDRIRVMQLCSFLYKELKEYLPAVPAAEECKEILLAECGLESDDVFGIMEGDFDTYNKTEYYQAFKSGIGFHSAALPNELRTYVEKRLLDSRDMRIVCSTETLAYGVNSSVDVVIIADLYKHEGGEVRPLSLNEFQNYSGRAGRIRKSADFSEIKGYVYTLINKRQLTHWNDINASKSTPEKLYSLFHLDQGQFMSFFLLNLLPAASNNSVTIKELTLAVCILPQDGSITDDLLEQKIRSAVSFLEKHGLATKVSSRPMGRKQRESKTNAIKYCLSELGKRLRGYIIGCDDYENLLKAVAEYVNGIFLEPDKSEFLFRLLCTKHAETGLNSIFSDSDTRISEEQVRNYIKQHLTVESNSDWLDTCKNTRVLFILAALLAWGDGESAKQLYRRYGIHYALLNKLAEQIAYLIEIAKEIIPSQMDAVYRENEPVYSKLNITFEYYSNAVNEKLTQIYNLFVSIYYGINTQIIQELLDYLQARNDDPNISTIVEELSLQHINPASARKLRRIVIRYKFFENPPEVDMENIEQRNNYLDQYRQYKKDVESFGHYIHSFFAEKFTSTFINPRSEVKI